MQEVKNRKKRKKREAITFSLTERLKSSRRFEFSLEVFLGI